MARNSKLTPELIVRIGRFIQGGAFDYVAAEAAGVCQRTFYNWLEYAERPDADPLFVEFAEEVERARSTARVSAEVRVMQEHPEIWLLKGPGRERPGRPGWTNENTLNVQDAKRTLQFIFVDEGNEPDAIEDAGGDDQDTEAT